MRLEMFLDEKKIRKSEIEDTTEYYEKLEFFAISPAYFDRETVEIDFGFGIITVSKEQFEKALEEYRKKYDERTVQHHINCLLSFLQSKDKEKAKIAIRVLREKLKQIK